MRPPSEKSLSLMSEWMRTHGGRYAVEGATYGLGLPAWISKSQLVASVDSSGLSQADCADIKKELKKLRVGALLSDSKTNACGVSKEIDGTGWSYWDLSEE